MQQEETKRVEPEREGLLEWLTIGPMRLVVSLIVPIVMLILLYYSFVFLRDSEANRILIAAVAIVVGVGAVWVMFWTTDDLLNRLNVKWQLRLRPFAFVGPALAILFFYLIFPTLRTIYLSFLNRTSDSFVGLDNYVFALTNPAMVIAIRNSVMWIIVVTALSVVFGLLIATLADRVRFESVAKSIIFLPMAISFVGASVIWRFVYAFQPAGQPQIGLLNAIVVGLGGEPVGWLITNFWNNFFLMVILIWLQTGFAMVLISAAIKGVPDEIIEAARIDGANEIQVFFNVTVPYIRPTLVTVSTTILILTLKIFDIVWVMTNGNFNTEVVASRMIKEITRFRDFGRGSAIAVILLAATVPIMIYNVRSFRETEATR